MIGRAARDTLFPYSTLFRSAGGEESGRREVRSSTACEGLVEELVPCPGGPRCRERAPRQAPRRPLTSAPHGDRKSTRLNSSHVSISYAVFCLKKKRNTKIIQ